MRRRPRTAEPIGGTLGIATAGVLRLTGLARTPIGERPFRLIAKRLRPGRDDPRHWAYWRREALAYTSGLLPAGPGLAAPRCYGVVDDVLYLEDVAPAPEHPWRAAQRLGAWQAAAAMPDVPWLGGHQLAQRVAASDLDWSAVPADPRLAAIWVRRDDLLAALDTVPRVLSHGDFHSGQLRDRGASTVVLDWATLSAAPVGSDAAHLALSVLADVSPAYLDGLAGRHPAEAVRLGYAVTVALTGAGRVHWMLRNGIEIPPGYVEFVLSSYGRQA